MSVDNLPTYSASRLASKQNPLLVCFSHLRWDFVYQRPQHLLSRAARSYNVVFVEEPIFEPNVEPRLHLSGRDGDILVAVPVLPEGVAPHEAHRMQQALVDELLNGKGEDLTVYWYYTPMAQAFSRPDRADVTVYDNMDELSAFRGAPPELIDKERELLSRADLVFTGGMSLYEAKRDRHSNLHAFPSSIDVPHFIKARSGALDPKDQAGIPRPRIAFFGVIDERMDIDLLARTAALRQDWQFVMVGPVVKIDPVTLPRPANIHWLGGKSYQELPTYLAGWDAGIMPFALNESTRFISPTKTPEFLAAGVPVVSTPITDVIRPYGDLGLVEIAATPEETVASLDMLLTRPKEDWLGRVDAKLSTMSWDRIWDEMHDKIRAIPTNRRSPSRPAPRVS